MRISLQYYRIYIFSFIVNSIINNPQSQLIPLLAKLPEVKEPFSEAKLLVALFGQIKTDTKDKKVSLIKDVPVKAQAEKLQVTFDWQGFLQKMQGLNEVIFQQLRKCEYEIVGDVLHLYPRTKIIKNILESRNNQKVLTGNVGGMKIKIHDAGEHPKSIKKDETLTKISDIMGGEVINDGGESPF